MVTKEMFETREKPWESIGTEVKGEWSSGSMLKRAGLDWDVVQKPIKTDDGIPIPGVRANVRSDNDYVLGIVSSKYQVVQNREAFSFLDELVGEGIVFERAGVLANGKTTWVVCRVPDRWLINSEEITPYLIFVNSHDGSGAIRCVLTPIRLLCSNSLNLALSKAKRGWSLNHVGDVESKMKAAGETLFHVNEYMLELGRTINELNQKKLTDEQVREFIEELLPMDSEATELKKNNVLKLRADMAARYFEAPDLVGLEKNAYRFINAVADHDYHCLPLKKRENYLESQFAQSLSDNSMINKAYQLVQAA